MIHWLTGKGACRIVREQTIQHAPILPLATLRCSGSPNLADSQQDRYDNRQGFPSRWKARHETRHGPCTASCKDATRLVMIKPIARIQSMTTKQKAILAIAGCGGVFVLLLLCGGVGGVVVWQMKAKPTLVGKWDGPGGFSYQFEKDGTLIMGMGGPGGLKGKYRLIDENHYETDFNGNKTRSRFQIVGNRLEIENEGGLGVGIMTFERAK
jgi:hypothetical protein